MMAVWSEVNIGEVRVADRFDPEYWQPAFLENERHLDRLKCITLGAAACSVRSGPFGSNLLCETYVPNGVAVIRPFNLKGMTIERDNIAYISEKVCSDSNLSVYRQGDIMIARVGDVRAGIAREVSSKMTISPNIIAVRLKDNGPSAYYVTAFLNTWPGLSQMLRGVKTVAQPTITTDLVRSIRVPSLPHTVQCRIKAKVQEAFRRDDDSKALYASAEGLLLSELDIADLDLSPSLFYECRYDEAQAASRIDAEFFMPRCKRILSAIKNTDARCITPLGDCLSFLTNGHTPLHHDLATGEVPFLTAEHVFNFRIEYQSEKRILREHHEGELKRTRLEEGDCLITIKGRIGNMAVAEEIEGAININQDVALFRLKDGLPSYYLAAFLNSRVGKALVEQYSTGQINPFLGLGNLRCIPIPVYERSRMDRIADKTRETVRAARAARDESRRLLEEAKKMVEEAVLG